MENQTGHDSHQKHREVITNNIQKDSTEHKNKQEHEGETRENKLKRSRSENVQNDDTERNKRMKKESEFHELKSLMYDLATEVKSLNDRVFERIDDLEKDFAKNIIENITKMIDTKISKEVNKVKDEFTTEVNTENKRIDSIVDKLRVDFQNLKSDVTEQVTRKEYAGAVSNNQTHNDTNIVIKMLSESEAEKTPCNYQKSILSVERKESRGRNPGVVVASVETCEQKEKIMKNKIKLRQTQEYNRVYIEDELTSEAQVNQTNMMAILKGMGRDKDFVFVNGKIKNKGNTHRRNETERAHEQSERNDRNEWRTVRTENGEVTNDTDTVLERWKTEYESAFNSVDSCNNFDDTFLADIKNRVQNENNYRNDIDVSDLNREISREEVKDAVYKAKLGKAIGIDEIPSEILRNDNCIDLLHKLFKFCFTEGQVPEEWLTSIITPIPKPKMDPLNPLEYRPISIISIPCKIYADILNKRLNFWLEQNDILAEEQNGFRKNRSCLDHLYVLQSIIKNRKLKKKDTFAPRSDFNFKCGDMPISFDNAYRYLGLHINEFMEHKYTIREITKSASRALSAVYTKFLSCGGMSFEVYTKLYKTLIEPVLLYGAGLWGHNNWREVQTIQNKACRLFMGSSSNASNVAVLGDLGYKTTKSAELLETYRLFLRVRYTYDYRITHKVHMWGMNISRSWDKKCYEIAHKLGIHVIIDSQNSNRHKIYDIKTKLCEIEKQEWVEKLYQDRNEPNALKMSCCETSGDSSSDVGESVFIVKFKIGSVPRKFDCSD
ncbi:unnamed protein product [Mytilus coruscus]|uniref:Uncharacterized protein n=1 Tax=Mytilus coruscus TaxID=42192 RepID=A0A6J8DC85_MYTCO|nr:unnamed protein product [Mytilus coruscus]